MSQTPAALFCEPESNLICLMLSHRYFQKAMWGRHIFSDIAFQCFLLLCSIFTTFADRSQTLIQVTNGLVPIWPPGQTAHPTASDRHCIVL